MNQDERSRTVIPVQLRTAALVDDVLADIEPMVGAVERAVLGAKLARIMGDDMDEEEMIAISADLVDLGTFTEGTGLVGTDGTSAAEIGRLMRETGAALAKLVSKSQSERAAVRLKAATNERQDAELRARLREVTPDTSEDLVARINREYMQTMTSDGTLDERVARNQDLAEREAAQRGFELTD